jgi:tetratricopeptide (TPR) repeat protein
LYCYNMSLKISLNAEYKEGESKAYKGLAQVMDEKNNLQGALDYYLKSLTIDREFGNEYEIANTTSNISNIYCSMGQFQKAITFARESVMLAKKTGSVKEQVYGLLYLSSALEGVGNYKDAYKALYEGYGLKDTMFNEQMTENINNLAIKYETEKKQLQIKSLKSENAAHNAEIKATKLQLEVN